MRSVFRSCAGIGLVAVLLGTGVGEVRADPVSVGDMIVLRDGPGGNNGGEFFADILGVGGQIDFITFCLQRNEYFTPGQPMYVGGISDHTVQGNNQISAQTAYLYTQFRNGALSRYDTSSTSAHIASATALQLAFWFLEGEVTSVGTNDLANHFITDARNSGWTGIGQVRVLNLFGTRDADGTFSGDRQDQLTLVPEPGTLALLLVGGAMALAGKRRRFRLK